MTKLHSHSIRTFVSIIMLALVSFTIISKAFYMHSHVNSLGIIVMHAHPFHGADESDSSSHSHSDFDLSSWLTFDNYQEGISVDIFESQATELQEYTIPITIGVQSLILTHTQGRAPPRVA